jgi:hypothetical protein
LLLKALSTSVTATAAPPSTTPARVNRLARGVMPVPLQPARHSVRTAASARRRRWASEISSQASTAAVTPNEPHTYSP